MEQNDPMFEESSDSDAKTWIQENLRIIVSVFIVAAIALGIYSYSQRTNVATDASDLLDTTGTEQSNDQGMTTDNNGQSDTVNNNSGTPNGNGTVTPTELSRETETSFVETAQRGNGTTHLARRALANYLEKNPDSGLSNEHKVYIEDYLRKQVGFKGTLTPNHQLEFSKDMIQQAIQKSKTLNDRQLQNLKKYSARVSAFR